MSDESVEYINTGLIGANQRVIPDGVCSIKLRSDKNKCVTLSKKSLDAKSFIFSSFTKESHQMFIIQYFEKENYYSIKSLYSQLYLGVHSTKEKSLVTQDSMSENFFAKWEVTLDNGFYFQLKETNYYLEYNTQNNILHIAKKNNSNEQAFTLSPVEIIKSGLYYIRSISSNLYITLSKKDKSSYSYLTSKNQSEDQIFYVVFDKFDGCYSIININNLFCLSSSKIKNSEINQSPFFNLDHKKWIIGSSDIKSGQFFILLKSNYSFLLHTDEKSKNRIIIRSANFMNSPISINDYFQFQELGHSIFHFGKYEEERKLEKYAGDIQNIMNFPYIQNFVFDSELNLESKFDNVLKKFNVKKTNFTKKIDSFMFQNSHLLYHLEIPEMFEKIDKDTFVNCTRIKIIKCNPKWLKLLPNPDNVENIIIPQKVTTIEKDSFQNFNNVKYLSLPLSLDFNSCDKSVFENILNLTVFEGDLKFLSIINKEKLTKILIPTGLEEIPENACNGCKYLQEIKTKLDSQLKIIGSLAFANCVSLKEFSVPESVINISPDAFAGCNKNFQLILKNDLQRLSMCDKLIVNRNINYTTNYYRNYVNISSIELLPGVKYCDPEIVKSFKKLKLIKCDPILLNYFDTNKIEGFFIPSIVSQIKKEHFDNLTHLRFVHIPESVTEIEEHSFDNCKELISVKCGTKHFKYLNQGQIKYINLNSETSSININDFEGFVNLESITIPDSIDHISPNVFMNCKKLINVNHPNGRSLINNSVSIDKNKTQIFKYEFHEWTNLEKLKIPRSVVSIEEDTFKNCTNLKCIACDPKWFPLICKESIVKIVIPNFIKELKKGQFDGFSSVSYIKLPNDVKIDDPSIFDSCENLKIIKCRSDIFTFLSEKTTQRCDKNLTLKYENPIFNFQLDPSLVYDETNLFNEADDSLYFTLTSSMTSSINSSLRPSKSPITTVDDLISYDNIKYKDYITNIIHDIRSNEIQQLNKPNDTSLSNISTLLCTICTNIYKTFDIIPRTVQIYAILRLADEILNENTHGSVAEIKTEEGKSFIITILAILLIQYGHTIDITTSNLNLAKHDQQEQSKYFELFDIKTAVFYDKRNDSEIQQQTPNCSCPDYFSEYDHSEFNDSNLEALEYPVVYSTNRYYEYYYLHTLFGTIPKKRELDIILVDEIDNMLIDEHESPAVISNEIDYLFSPNILQAIYLSRCLNIDDIIFLLRKDFPNAGEFNHDDIELFKKAALKADNKIKNIDYIIEDKKVVIIDHKTHLKIPNCNWPNYVYEFVEIKENIIPKSLSISLCQITQQIYIDQYKKIGCVTGTLGSKADEQILKEYNVKSFKVPRNIPSKVEIYYKNRPRSIDDIFNTVYQEIVDIKSESRPVLIIWDSKENSENFKEFLGLKEIEPVIQLGFDTDENILNTIGQSSNILNTTSFEVRKIVIKLSEQLINAGGLHVIIPMKITNLSLLEQAVGKAGRDGQKGSVTILIDKNDLFIDAPLYNHKNKNLQKLEIEFSKYIITNFPWMISGPKNNNFDDKLVFPFLANYSDIYNILSRKIFLIFKNETKKSIKTDEKVSNKFQDLAWKMVQTAWGVFFTKMKNDTFNNDSSFYCDKSYNRFIKELNKFLDSTEITSIYSAFKFIKSLYENDIYNESIIYNDYEVSSSNFDIISTNKTNQSIINLEMIPNSKNGPTLDWIVDTIEQLHNYIEDSKKNLPNMQVLAKTPKVELPNVDISLIKLALKFASEAYNGGHFSIGKVIFSSETNDLFKPVFYCIEHQNKLFVATRGSDSKFDWMTDFTCYEVIKEINGSDVYFHKGFLAAASYILSLISEFMQRDYSEIYFVGHSYAAAVSNVLCMLSKAHEKFKDKKIFSFAFAPPPSVSKIPGCIQECMFSFINKYDIVPHLSLRNIQNTINLQKIPVDIYLNKAKFILRSFNSDYSNTFADLIEQYEDELSKSLNSAKNDLHVHKNIGNLFYIGLTESRKLKNCQIDETDLTNIVFFSPSMLKHHKVTEYIDSLAKINTY